MSKATLFTKEEAAWEAAGALARALHEGPERPGDASLVTGMAGIALFLGYWAREAADEAARERATDLLDAASDLMVGSPLVPAFFPGFPGVAWTVAHLEREGLVDSATDLEEVDEIVVDFLQRHGARMPFDLMQGLVGQGVYFLERLPSPAARQGLARIVDALAGQAEPGGEGIRWRTPREHLAPFRQEIYPGGWYDLGMAHGSAGVIAFLARVVLAGVEVEKARGLLGGAVAWLLGRELPAGAASRFPNSLPAGQGPPPEASRIAWCYGDPGIAAALLLAADALDDPSLRRRGLELFLAAAERGEGESGVADACLCHGAVGVGHLLHRGFRATGEPRLAAAARRWFEVGLRYRREPAGVAGFSYAHITGADGSWEWRPERGLLEGAAGIGLALLAATSPLEPAWDRVFLLSAPAMEEPPDGAGSAS